MTKTSRTDTGDEFDHEARLRSQRGRGYSRVSSLKGNNRRQVVEAKVLPLVMTMTILVLVAFMVSVLCVNFTMKGSR